MPRYPKTHALARQMAAEALEELGADLSTALGWDSGDDDRGGAWDALLEHAYDERQDRANERNKTAVSYLGAVKAIETLLKPVEGANEQELDRALWDFAGAHEVAGFVLGVELGKRLGGAR